MAAHARLRWTLIYLIFVALAHPVWAQQPASVLKPGDPQAHGVKPADLEALRAILKGAVDDRTLPGTALLVAHNGEVIFKEAFGNMTVDKVIPVASVTKPITATTIMRLVEEKKITLDEPINTYIPEFNDAKVRGGAKPEKPITVRMLLSHTAGLPTAYTSENRNFSKTTADSVCATAMSELQTQPGSRYAYSGVNFDVAARATEVAAKVAFEDLVQQYVFDPLGMKHSGFNKPAGAPANKPGEGRYLQAGGGMRTNLDDLAAFYQMHLNGGRYGDVQILSPASIAEMRKKQASIPGGGGQAAGAREYGIGLFRQRIDESGNPQTIGHGGALGAIPWIDVDRNIVGIFLTESQLAQATPVANRLQAKVREIIPDKPAAKAAPPPAEVKAAFLKLLERPHVPADLRQVVVPRTAEGLVTESFTIATEKAADGHVERVPTLLVRPEKAAGRMPAVIVLHGTGGSKEQMRSWLADLARRGIVGVAIDARYHGARAPTRSAYNDAIIRAWRAEVPAEHPFLFDTCYDLWRLVDYLVARDDVDPNRIGMMGISMGGMETWLSCAVDERVKVVVPCISVQSFRWSLENEAWQGRAGTIRAAHEAARADLKEPTVNSRVCRELWTKVIPGILDEFDCPSMLRLLAGRPMLIVSGELDPNCPIQGAEVAFAATKDAYAAAGASDKLKINVAMGSGHTVTAAQRRLTLDWFVEWLKP